ncbi:MAG TPA: L28 family ribosomal protein [Patescibacteria group bacterium]|nr:L28 family ribosomal protein [Patescibacteria group bacterium]
MALSCDICGKHSVAGGSHVHHRGVAGGQWKRRATHTKRTIGVNLHWVSLPVKGIMTRMRICAKCTKRVRFENKRVVIAV